MKRLMTIAALAAVAISTAAYTPAQAHDGGAVAAGVIGGLAVGAIIGSAAQRNYYGGPAYGEPHYAPVYGACHIERQQIVDRYGYVHYRRIRVCD